MVSSLRIILIVLAATLSQAAGAGANQGPALRDPVSIYGEEARYEVLRDGAVVGSHVMTFDRRGPVLLVSARMELELRFLAFTVYSYLYQSLETWTDRQLEALSVQVDDDGKQSSLVGTRQGESFVFEGHGSKGTADGLIFPTNHWNAEVLEQDRVLNTLTGLVNAVQIRRQGKEEVRANGAMIEATRYRYNGDLETEVWYDDEGRWVRMQFKAKDGSTIVYRCKRCKAEAT